MGGSACGRVTPDGGNYVNTIYSIDVVQAQHHLFVHMWYCPERLYLQMLRMPP